MGLTGFEHISVAIGIGDLPSSPSSSSLGTIFYAGNYTPVSHEMEKPPYQNFVSTDMVSGLYSPNVRYKDGYYTEYLDGR